MRGRLTITALLLTVFIIAEITIATNTMAENIVQTNNPEIITVDRNGDGDYKSIQKAVNSALDGSTIYVKKGVYSEIIDINKKINLLGEDKDKTIINPISEKNKYAIRLGAPEIKIRNISVTNGAPGLYTTGIRISASKTEIHDCIIYDTPVGIAIWTSNNIINNCNFWGCEDEGIALIGSQYSKCDNNKITNSLFHNNCDGIELQYSSNNVITSCEFFENTHTGIDGIASSNDKNTISNCKIYDNKVHGIYFSSSSNNQIIDCSIVNNHDGNIIMNSNSKNNIVKSTSDNSKNNIVKSTSDSDLENSNTNQVLTETTQRSYESNKENHDNDIINRIYNLISNQNFRKILPLLLFIILKEKYKSY